MKTKATPLSAAPCASGDSPAAPLSSGTGAAVKNATMNITLSKGGTGERTVKLETLIIPDLWHLALRQESKMEKDAILEVWHLAHDLKNQLIECRKQNDAAPDLLAVCREVAQWLAETHCLWGDDGAKLEFQRLESVIAKAEGRAE